jgi:hypothetical protein
MNSNRCHGQEYTQYTGWIADVFQRNNILDSPWLT